MSDEKQTEKKTNESTKTPEKVVGGSQSYSGTKTVNTNNAVKTETSKTVTIQFRDNRKFDLHVGRNMVTFKGREAKSIPAEWLNHKDWQSIKNYFIVKGV